MIKQNGRHVIPVLVGLVILSHCANWSVLADDKDAPKTPSVVRARSFELVDDEGKIRAKLEFREGSSSPQLVLLDEEHQPSVTLYVNDERGAAGLTVMDNRGSAVLRLGCQVGAFFQLFMGEGSSKAYGLQLAASKTVPPYISVFDATGRSASMGPSGVDKRQTSRPSDQQVDKPK